MTCLTFRRWCVYISIAALCVVVVGMACVSIGPDRVAFGDVFVDGSLSHAIVFHSRLPRVLTALMVGVALSSAGGALQVLFRNPLADPFIIGVSGGAALGSVLAVWCGAPFWFVSVAGFLAGLLSMIVVFNISRTVRCLNVYALLLTGVVYNALCFAVIMFVNSIATVEQAHELLFLLVGSLSANSYDVIGVLTLLVLVPFVILSSLSYRMNILALGDESAICLGVDVEKFKLWIFFLAALMVGAAVSVSGLIGFVGLVVPHMVRFVFGSDHRLLIPFSGMFGAAFLAVSDTIARTVFAVGGVYTQLPVGVITALVGAPAFFYLLKGRMKQC